MYFNVFLYNTITGDSGMIAAMVAASAVVGAVLLAASLISVLFGRVIDRYGKRQAAAPAPVYTQVSDVEEEVNGLLTYDRRAVKVDVGRVKAVNREQRF